MQTEQLERIVANVPGCELLAFADIRTGVTLTAAGNGDFRRDELDAFCAQAAVYLNPPNQSCNLSVKVSAGKIRFFLRDGDHLSEALLCRCTAETDLPALFQRIYEGSERPNA